MTFWLDRPVFITGATGLVGSWLTKALYERGADVVALVRDWRPQSMLIRSRLLDKITVVRGDVRDQKLIERILAEYEIKTVFHLAAQTIVGIAYSNPVNTFDNNIYGSIAICDSIRAIANSTQIIIASSDKSYGVSNVLPYTENTPLRGTHPYEVSKSCGDLLADSYRHTYGMNIAIARCGNIYGGGDLNWNRIIPGTIRSVIREMRPLIRSDGKMIRDYFYVEDVVKAYMLLAEKEAVGAYNFSNEQPMSVIEIVWKIIMMMGAKLVYAIQNIAHNEIEKQTLSAEKAHRELGWYAEFSLDEGLNRTIEWYREYFND